MKTVLKKLIKRFTTSQQRVLFKKTRRYIYKLFCQNKRKTTLLQLKHILIDEFKLKEGDHIIVSSSFGNLNAGYTPREVIELLQSIVTENGVIMMPYYPPMNSDEWAKGGCIFDMRETKSGTGILTNIFSKMPDVYKSKHPTKAVCVWGKDAQKIIAGHEEAQTPFYWDSPYGKLLTIGSKSLGLGLKNIPIFHSFEDILSCDKSEYYDEIKYELKLRNFNGDIETVNTYVHNTNLLGHCISVGDYVASLGCSTFKKINFGYNFVYVIDNIELLRVVKEQFSKGNTRLKK